MSNWTILQKIFFRLGSCYILLYAMSNQFITYIATEPIWQIVVPWFEDTFMNLPGSITVFTNGSGDTTYNYVSLLVYAIISVFVTIIWSIADRKRHNYNYLLQWLQVVIRYYLAYLMLSYGLAKIFYLQFQPPSFARLVQAYGDSSPMGILWTFMGQSKGYTMFTGFVEFFGGLLLIYRRTSTLGAIVVLVAMTNVMALNYFYDVPVKLLSTHIVLMTLILILLDSRRLINIFISNKPTQSIEHLPYFKNNKLNTGLRLFKCLFIIGVIGYWTHDTFNMTKVYGTNVEKPKLYGLYEVTKFIQNGDTLAPLLTDDARWRRLIVEQKDRASIYTMTDKRLWYDFKPDTIKNIVRLNPANDSTLLDSLYFSEPDSTRFVLEGILNQDAVRIEFSKKTKEDFLLRSRGFAWINEYPFNR